MSSRCYEPPQIDNRTPNDVLYINPGAKFTNILQKRDGEITRSRSIAIFIDGACPGNGTRFAHAGMGVFFGPKSCYNFSEQLRSNPQTNQRAEILAAYLALREVRRLLKRDALSTKTVVLISDSAYLVGAMTEWIYKWMQNGWTNAKGGDVANRRDFEALNRLINELEYKHGVYVRFWLVDRWYNQDADKLAKGAS